MKNSFKLMLFLLFSTTFIYSQQATENPFPEFTPYIAEQNPSQEPITYNDIKTLEMNSRQDG